MIFFIGKEVLKRRKNLRDAFVKAEKKAKECKASGSKATKKRKYIFHEELRFLNKVYNERQTADSYNNVNNVNNQEDTTDDIIEVSTVNKEVEKTTASKSSPKTRKRKKLDEIDLKILKALEQEQPNSEMSFFQSLLPHIQQFNENGLLDFKMDVLQVISKINSKRATLNQTFSDPPPLHYQYNNQPTYYYQQNQSHPQPTASSSMTNNLTSVPASPTQLQSNAQEKKKDPHSVTRYYASFLPHNSDSNESSERSYSGNSAFSSMTYYDFSC